MHMAENLRRSLKSIDHHLRTSLKNSLAADSECIHHCLTFALSDPDNEEFAVSCSVEHKIGCNECEQVTQLEAHFIEFLESSSVDAAQKSVFHHDISVAIENIQAWKAHLIRASNQSKSKTDILDSLDEISAFVIDDFAQKWLPRNYREKMKDYFGKRGINWHVSCVVMLGENKEVKNYDVVCLVYIVQDCKQDWYSVASFREHGCKELKK